MLALSKTLLAVLALASVILPETNAVGIRRNSLNATTNVGLVERQSYPSYTFQSTVSSNPPSVPFSDITCSEGSVQQGFCYDVLTGAMEQVLTDYAGILSAWYNNPPGISDQNPGYYSGCDGSVCASLFYANPIIWDNNAAMEWLENWNSYETALQIVDFMSGADAILVCVEPWDYIGQVAFAGAFVAAVGWNGSPYDLATEAWQGYFLNCQERF